MPDERENGNRQNGAPTAAPSDKFFVQAPSLSLPKGGGAIRGIGEKFTVNPVTGTGSLTVPIATSPGTVARDTERAELLGAAICGRPQPACNH